MLQNVLVRLLINNTVKFFYGYAASLHGFSAYILQTKSKMASINGQDTSVEVTQCNTKKN